MKNLSPLNFYGNHSLNFYDNDINALECYAISELRKIAIPDKILLMEYDALLLLLPHADLSTVFDIENWRPLSYNMPTVYKFPKVNVVSIGPMAMRIVFTPNHIILPSSIYEPVEWYSPDNKENVQAWRSYFYAIITHFGGDHALYVDDRKSDKYYKKAKVKPDISALNSFEQSLILRYGETKKSMFDYPQGKFPEYYIDSFADIKEPQYTDIS